MYTYIIMRLLIYSSILIFVLACQATIIEPSPLSSQSLELAQSSQRKISIHIQSEVSSIIGYQYALIILPLGQISFKDAKASFYASLVEELAIRNIAIATNQSQSLILKIKKISISAYDLIIVRRISCTIELESVLLNQDKQALGTWRTIHNYSDFYKLAFESEINQVFNTTIQETINQTLDGLGL